MALPFTTEQFLQLFQEYNLDVYPLQFLLYIPAIVGILMPLTKNRMRHLLVTLSLTLLWTWSGIAYHVLYFTTINPAAWAFGIIFLLEACLLFYYGVIRQNLMFRFIPSVKTVFGAILIAFSLIIYPVLSIFFGHHYPAMPTFGLPCPTTIFTLGLFLWTTGRFPWVLLIIPLSWAIIGSTAAFTLGIFQDTSLLVAAIISLLFIILHNRQQKRAA